MFYDNQLFHYFADISQQSSNGRSAEVNIQNTGKSKGKNKENGQSNGETVGNGKTKQKESKKQKGNKAAADKQNTNTGNTNSNSNNKTNNNSNEESVQIFTDSTNVESPEQLTSIDNTLKPDFREQTFGMGVSLPVNDENNIDLDSDRHSLLDSHDLLDNSDHSLLEDNDNHDLLNDSLLGKNNLINSHRILDPFILPAPEASRILQRNFETPNGDINADYNMVNNRDVNFLNIAALNNPLVDAQKSILLNNDILRSKDPYIPFVNPLDNFQHPSNIQQSYPRMGQNYAMYSSQNMTNSMLTPTLANSLINENGLLSDGKYGENNMNKFFNDFHKNQQLKTISNQGNLELPNNPLANIQPSEMQSLQFVESQHLQKKYGLGGDTHLNYNGRQQTEKLGR